MLLLTGHRRVIGERVTIYFDRQPLVLVGQAGTRDFLSQSSVLLDEHRYCIDILTQIAAVKAALEQVGTKLLEGHVNHCVHDAIASGDAAAVDEKTAELLDALRRFVKTR